MRESRYILLPLHSVRQCPGSIAGIHEEVREESPGSIRRSTSENGSCRRRQVKAEENNRPCLILSGGCPWIVGAGKGEKVVQETTSRRVTVVAVPSGGCKFAYTIVMTGLPARCFYESNDGG